MLTVVELDFNHDFRDKTARFEAFAASVTQTNNFANEPLIEASAVFSYGRTGKHLIDSLFSRMGDRDAVIFLSDICSYSYALLQSESQVHGLGHVVAKYESRQRFRENPRVCGNCITDPISLCIDPKEATYVGMMPSPYSTDLTDEDTDLPNPEIVNVLLESPGDWGSVFVYRLENPKRYFDSISRCDYATYVIPKEIDAELLTHHYHQETLTGFLQSSGCAFGTLNDNHQDDLYSVSYFKPIWKLPDETLAFIA